MKRILTALVLIPPFLAILLLAPAWSFLLLAEAVALAAVHEFFGLTQRGGYRPFRIMGYAATALLTLSFHPDMPAGNWAVLVVLVVIGLAAVARGTPTGKTLGEVSSTLLGVFYAGALSGAVVGLRYTPPDGVGRSWVFFLLLVILLGDTGAYYTGRALGRRPLAKKLSPKKTIEGLVGGLALSILTAVLLGPLLIPHLDRIHATGLGLLLGLLGAAGDLFESLLKRAVGLKDTSSLFPGHGGILDRLDAVFFAAPALWLYVLFVYLQ
jgi:phosphatidate cytidylyltransferase